MFNEGKGLRKGGTINNTRNEIHVAHTTQNSYWSKSMCPSIKPELHNTLDCERSKETGVEDLTDGHIDFDQLEFCSVWATRISVLPVSLQINGLLDIQVRETCSCSCRFCFGCSSCSCCGSCCCCCF